jgi:hypothetical protein
MVVRARATTTPVTTSTRTARVTGSLNRTRNVERVAAGEEIIIGKAGKPVARPIPYRETPPRRKPGSHEGKMRMARDF